MFEYDDYHIYTTNDRLEKQYVHLSKYMLQDAADLHKVGQSNDEWQTVHRMPVADNIYLTVGDGVRGTPRLQSRGYEGWMPVDDGDFEEQVFFDTMLFHKCIGTSGFEPEWSFNNIREWVSNEHRAQFEHEFDEYLTDNYDTDDVIVDW